MGYVPYIYIIIYILHLRDVLNAHGCAVLGLTDTEGTFAVLCCR